MFVLHLPYNLLVHAHVCIKPFFVVVFRLGAVAKENFHQDTFPNLLHRSVQVI